MAATHMDRDTFLAHLRRSELLTAAQFAEALRGLPDSPRGRVVARALVRRGLLTRFQAELLLAGRTNGFRLGQYRILGPLGRGGMGRVFRAVHLTMNRVVALKLVSAKFVNTEVGRKLFEREVRAAARLMHGNIVTAYDANQVGGRSYLIMEFVDGPNLDELVRERGPLEVGLACELVRQAAAGLQYAGEMGMVHRDIKPANLLVQRATGRDGRCVLKILDFGLARFHHSERKGAAVDDLLARENTLLGTPDFLSPEQARHLGAVDIRSDLYSLGCTFYYLLTGQVPFPGGTSLEKLARHGTTEPRPVEELRPEVPPAVAAVVRRLMAKEPAARFQTPAELAEALAPFAVDGLLLWAGERSEGASSDVQGPPESSGGSANPGQRGGEALLSTVTSRPQATPFSATGLSSILRRGLDWQSQKRRLTVALGAALAVAAALLAWVCWLLFRH